MPEQPQQPRRRAKIPLPADKTATQPWTPIVASIEDVGALRAVYNGTAAEHQQRRAMDFIMKRICGVGTVTFVPGAEEGRRATDFKAGMQFVGLEIASLIVTKTKPGGEQS